MNAVVHMCLCALVALQVCESSPTNSSVRTSGIPNWTKKILKLQPNPVDIGAPPPYMLHLYNRYRKGRLPYSTANTVRSFLPIPGKLGGRDILVFNLTGVHATEYIERADLHLHSKRQLRNSRIKRSNLRLSIVDLSRFTRPQVDNVFLTRISAGWHTVEITDSVISCLDGEAEDQRLMGLLPHADEDATNLVDLSKLSTLPFLVVFSEDDEHLAIGDLEERSRNLRLRDFAPKNATSEKGDRFKRELLDNELPDYPQPPSDTSAAEIQARLKHKPLDSPVLTYSKNVKGKSNNGKHRKRRRRRRRKERRLPVAWGKGWWKTGGRNNYDSDKSEEGNPTDEGLEVNSEHICQRRKLVVDLSEIGWSAWIISPSSFDAYYCSGLCSFPLPKTGQPTNHATIQSLVHSLGLSEDVPNPCCVPESLAPLTMLFFDQDRNVVLKSYPSMTVENCVCR